MCIVAGVYSQSNIVIREILRLPHHKSYENHLSEIWHLKSDIVYSYSFKFSSSHEVYFFLMLNFREGNLNMYLLMVIILV